MAKYDPLRRYLRRQRGAEIELSFAEIERILGAMLPHAASRPEWWIEDISAQVKGVQQAAWRDAGYRAFLIKQSERVHFRRQSSPAN